MEYTYGLTVLRAHSVHATKRRIKSTAAEEDDSCLNNNFIEPWAQVLQMDGFHYPRRTLDMMPNKDKAYARRGADWTFDAPKLFDFVQNLRGSNTKSTASICAPEFDHALKDSTEDAIEIGPHIFIVILQSSWLLLDEEP
ncbi:hypothetical protein E4T39_07434 [Aureobasidium subglaciale]|nr:hypothetical protein E4T39_07434 [Aureobasidium subglaciale]